MAEVFSGIMSFEVIGIMKTTITKSELIKYYQYTSLSG